MVFNGDILSGVDLSALLDTHARQRRGRHPAPGEGAGSAGVRLACRPTTDGRVQAFLEKTENPPTDQINAGCYVFRREVVEAIPAGRVVSVERETFPGLLADGRPGGRARRHHLLARPRHAGRVRAGARPTWSPGWRRPTRCPARPATALVLPGARGRRRARVLTGGSTIGRDAIVGDDAEVDASVLFAGARSAAAPA